MVRRGAYAPLQEPRGWRGHRARRSWLRMAQLNIVGWSALLGVCVVTAVAGVAVMAALGWPSPFGAVGAVVPLILIVVADRRKWAGTQSSFGWGGSVGHVAGIAAELEARGVHVRVLTEDIANGWGERVHPPTSDPVVKTAVLEYVNRDADAVAEVLRRHGIRTPGPF